LPNEAGVSPDQSESLSKGFRGGVSPLRETLTYRAAFDAFAHRYWGSILASADGKPSKAAHIAQVNRTDFHKILRRHEVARTERDVAFTNLAWAKAKQEFMRGYWSDLLAQTGRNISAAARLSGCNRTDLHKRLKKLNIITPKAKRGNWGSLTH
jgi:transcriptional regulator of acetoin/glycerol metabolism